MKYLFIIAMKKELETLFGREVDLVQARGAAHREGRERPTFAELEGHVKGKK